VKVFAGEADFLEKVIPENIPQIGQANSLRLEMNLPLVYGFLGFNLHARPGKAGSTAASHPIFGDARVRRALTMSLDRPRLVRATLDSLGIVAFGPAPRALIPDTTSLRAIPYNVAAAKALLDSAGWIDGNGDGVRERDGKPLAFELLAPSQSPSRIKFAELTQAALKEVGAEVSVQVVDGPSALGPRLDAHDFDAWVGTYNANPGLQGTRQTWVSRGSMNYHGYVSPAFDALVDSALTTFDTGRARGLWSRALQRAIDDAPSAWLYEERIPIVVHKRIRMAPLRADGWYANLADWSVDPAQRIDRDKVGLGAAR
jgi:peptide/nickel transport system substrate-binding protein